MYPDSAGHLYSAPATFLMSLPSFIQQICTKHLLCARNEAQRDTVFADEVLMVWSGRQTILKYIDILGSAVKQKNRVQKEIYFRKGG